jgi:hypothetical protein
MPKHATPGLDGFPSEFLKVFAGVDSKAVDATTGSKSPAPNPLAALLGQAFREMLAAGSMSNNMQTGIISFLFKKTKVAVIISATTAPSQSSTP